MSKKISLPKNFKYIVTFCALALLSACLINSNKAKKEKANAEALKAAATLTSGNYKLDKSHASLTFRINHLGLSRYTARFKKFDADLNFDPVNPEKSSVNAVIDAASLETDYPDKKTFDFNAVLGNSQWLNTKAYPKIIFRSTKVVLTGIRTARIEGQATLHGVTLPLTIYAVFNGGYDQHLLDPAGSRIGFSAKGSLKRSEFGITTGIPSGDSKFGVADDVEFMIEAEFTKPK